MRRRSFLAFALSAVLCMTLSVCMVLEGCSASDEAVALLNGSVPFVQGILAVVALADPPLAPIVVPIAAGYGTAVNVFDQAYATWQAALPSEQPGKFGAVEAAITAVKTELASLLTVAHVKDANRQNTIEVLFAAAQNAVTEVFTFVSQVKGAGGTTAAAEMILHEQYGGGREPQTATKTAKASKVKVPKIPIDHVHMSADLKKRLAFKTGDPQLDAVRASIASKLK